MSRYLLTIFLSSFLLFQLQPLIAKPLLPLFGGAAGVWTVCMLFFQVALLGGYAYANLVSVRLSRRRQCLCHIGLLAVSLALLPIASKFDWKPTVTESPTGHILLLLSIHIGVPFVVLSSTTSLLSRWYSLTFPGRSPYRLYALSNTGSLLALLSYPFLVEPALTVPMQALLWSWGYFVFVVLCGWCAWRFHQTETRPEPPDERGIALAATSTATAQTADAPSTRDALLWLCLAATASTMLLATTNRICQDVAVVPLLWVLPLAIYLITFILCFGYDRWYQRRIFGPLLAAVGTAVVFALQRGNLSIWINIGIYSAMLFVACTICHGELARSRPAARHLTRFYLVVAAGGAVGGISVAVVAPYVFPDYWEYHAAIIATGLLALVSAYRNTKAPNGTVSVASSARRGPIWASACIAFVTVSGALVWNIFQMSSDKLLTARSFYGVIHVERLSGSGGPTRSMVHGRICHGTQFIERELRHLPTTYYGWDSGVGLALKQFRQQRKQGLRIGVIGLGTGTICALAERGDSLRYYEINRDVDRIARKYFTYLSDTKADVDVEFGDARLLLEREARRGMNQHFDVLIVDAFDGDAIPLHLLTREAFDVYWSHLKPDGLLAVHVSNRYVDLAPVVRGQAMLSDRRAIQVISTQHEKLDVEISRWILVTNNQRFLTSKAVNVEATPWPKRDSRSLVWTDESANLWSVIGGSRTVGKWESAPNKGRFVMDDASMVRDEDKDRIQSVCRTLYHDTAGVNPIMVVTVKSMAKAGAPDISFAAFRKQMYRQTRMFKPQGDSGAMILISIGDHQSAIYLGSDWPQDLRERVSRIGRETLVAGLVANQASSGILKCVEQLDQLLREPAATRH